MPVIIVEGLSNQEFLDAHARPGRIGLVGGTQWANRLLGRAQRHVNEDKAWSCWSHAFLFQGRRTDGHHWIIESDLDVRRKHIRLGVQENRTTKYFDDGQYGAVAVLDLGLTPEQTDRVLGHALGWVAAGARYSLREIVGTAWALRHPRWRPKENLLARDKAFYCSAFVRHVFGQAGFNLTDGIAEKNTTPEDIAQMSLPHTKWMMVRTKAGSRAKKLIRRVRSRLRSGRKKLFSKG